MSASILAFPLLGQWKNTLSLLEDVEIMQIWNSSALNKLLLRLFAFYLPRGREINRKCQEFFWAIKNFSTYACSSQMEPNNVKWNEMKSAGKLLTYHIIICNVVTSKGSKWIEKFRSMFKRENLFNKTISHPAKNWSETGNLIKDSIYMFFFILIVFW